MSDLHRAVQDELDAFRPDRMPPFAELVDRHRSRSRRRRTLAVAVPVLAAVLAAPVVWSAATGGGDELLQQAGPSLVAGAERAAFLPPVDPEAQPGVELIHNTALAQGVLDGDPATGCLWLSATNYGRSTTTPIRIRHETAVVDFSSSPWVIRDGGTILATQGEQVRMGGGYTPEEVDQAVPGCPVEGQPFVGGVPTAVPEQPTPGPQETDRTGASEGTRYGIKYDNEAAYNRQDEAVQACLDLPGVAPEGMDASLPPAYSLVVTGIDENAAFRLCLSGLAGVALTEFPPFDPETAPPAFLDRVTLPSCGYHSAGHGRVASEASNCFAEAVGSDAGAELVVSRLTEEGDPIVVWYRALPGQRTVEVFVDSTRDQFGRRTWQQTTCTGYDRNVGAATGCPPNGTGQF